MEEELRLSLLRAHSSSPALALTFYTHLFTFDFERKHLQKRNDQENEEEGEEKREKQRRKREKKRGRERGEKQCLWPML